MNIKTLQSNISQVHIFWSLVVLIAASIFLYIYFVNVAIFHTAERSHIEDSIIDLKSSISQMELELIDHTRTITLDYAYTLGFSDIANPTFVKRADNTRVTLNDL